MTEHRPTIPSSPLHSSTLGLRRSIERNLERQPSNLKFSSKKKLTNFLFCLYY
jgi:hypothetical protein